MDYYNAYLLLIVLIKVGFYSMVLTELFLKHKGDESSHLYKTIVLWEKKFEFIYILLVGLLLIFLFNPFFPKTNMINKETKIILFITGIILTIRAKWYVFTDETKWFEILQTSI